MRTKLQAAVTLAAETNLRRALLAGLVPVLRSHSSNSSWPFAQSSARLTTAVLLCTSLLVDGCATPMPASTRVPSVQSWANSNGGSTGNGPAPAERLATVPRIVADEQPVDVSGFEITGEERARLQALRSANIRAGTVNPFADPMAAVECLVKGVIVLCPFVAAFAGIGVLTYNAGSMAVRAAKDDTYIPPKGVGDRLAALFSEHAPSITLRNEVSKRMLPHPEVQSEFPRLVVGIESARLVPVFGGATFEVRARSQSFTAPDKKGAEMTHQVTSPTRNVDDWFTSNGKLFRDDLAEAFDALSANIVSVYMPEQLEDPTRAASKP